jgi:hypothetical protein
MAGDMKHLPVIENEFDQDEASCSPKIYVSNEEAALLDAMRSLREQSKKLKKEMCDAEPEQRSQLESRLGDLRAEWKDLAALREKAFIRKMIMLGHLPPEADPDHT